MSTKQTTKKRTGRKYNSLKLTPELMEVIVEIMELPQSKTVACEAAGIERNTFDTWQKRGKAAKLAKENGEEISETEELLIKFFERTSAASAVGRVELVNTIKNAAKMDWKASAWMLQKMFPEDFAKQNIRIEGANGEKIGGDQIGVKIVIEGDPKKTE